MRRSFLGLVGQALGLPRFVTRTFLHSGFWLLGQAIRPIVGHHAAAPVPKVGNPMGHEFLSTQWITAVQALRAEYPDPPAARHMPAMRVNLDVTGAPPDIAADGTVHAHAVTGGPTLVVQEGPLPDPDLTVVTDYHTAYELLVDQRPGATVTAFLAGRIRLAGNLEELLARTGFDPAALPGLLAGLGVTGTCTLADLNPTAAEIGERIRALTA